MKLNNKGFGAVEIILIIVLVGILGFVGYRAYDVYVNKADEGREQNKYGFSKKDKKENNLTSYKVDDLNVSFSYPKSWGDASESTITETANDNSESNIGTKITFAEFKETELAINLYTKRLSGGGSGCVSTVECVSFMEEIVYKASYKFVKDGDSAKITMVNNIDTDGSSLIDETKIVSIDESKLLFRNEYNFTLEDVLTNADEIDSPRSEAEARYNTYVAEAHNQHHFAILNGNESGPFIGGNAFFTPEGSVEKELIDQFIATVKSFKLD